MAVRGDHLDSVGSVVFLGGAGRADDRRARPRRHSDHRVLVRVPSRAGSGPVRAVSASGTASRAVRITVVASAQPLAVDSGAGVFPVQGKYSFGTSVNRFGGGRGHKGQDIFARCGTPIAAALGGKVVMAGWQSAAGNYAVVTNPDGRSQAYMHMLQPATVRKGDDVPAGANLGQVGETGRASGCHLHFELWTAPGWYTGGSPIDPLTTLESWAAAT
jgi:murein DD-endopeptidase MepM/ murein hydrolase activator NlpD